MTKKVNTWAIAEEIEEAFGWRSGNGCLQEASFGYDIAKEEDNKEDPDDEGVELDIWISGDI